MEDTLAFYRRLGFVCEVASANGDYAIAERGSLEVHFFLHEQLLPAESSFGAYFRVNDVGQREQRQAIRNLVIAWHGVTSCMQTHR